MQELLPHQGLPGLGVGKDSDTIPLIKLGDILTDVLCSALRVSDNLKIGHGASYHKQLGGGWGHILRLICDTGDKMPRFIEVGMEVDVRLLFVQTNTAGGHLASFGYFCWELQVAVISWIC